MTNLRIVKQVMLGAILATLIPACATPPSPAGKAVDWAPARIAFPPTADLTARAAATTRPPLGKFSLRFYQKLKAHPAVASLAEVDIWDLRDHPRRYDVITIGPAPVRQFSGKMELLDQLAATHGLSKEKAQVLTNWVKSGGVVWIEFGVFIQGYEWIENDNVKLLPALPDLKSFTIFGFSTRSYAFEAVRRGAFAVELAVFSLRNEAEHEATADIKSLKLVQSDLKAIYTTIDGDPGKPLIREGDRVYATVAPLGQGKVVSTLPFDEWDAGTDGEKFRINLFEWLAGYPIPAFDPKLDVERQKD